MLLTVFTSVLFLSVFNATPAKCRPQNIEAETKDTVLRNRLRRSLFVFGSKVVNALFDGTRFIYSNGIDEVFVKPGGLKKALEDFEFANTAKRVKNLLSPGQPGIAKKGKVGKTLDLILRQDGGAGSAVLQIAKPAPVGTRATLPTVHKIIVYSD